MRADFSIIWGNITTKGDYMEYVLEYHTDSVKPWTVLVRRVLDYWGLGEEDWIKGVA